MFASSPALILVPTKVASPVVLTLVLPPERMEPTTALLAFSVPLVSA